VAISGENDAEDALHDRVTFIENLVVAEAQHEEAECFEGSGAPSVSLAPLHISRSPAVGARRISLASAFSSSHWPRPARHPIGSLLEIPSVASPSVLRRIEQRSREFRERRLPSVLPALPAGLTIGSM
jgi:hypothetical protein